MLFIIIITIIIITNTIIFINSIIITLSIPVSIAITVDVDIARFAFVLISSSIITGQLLIIRFTIVTAH
jgi:hypothetical protein